jgi:hypothetical protein
MEEKRSQPGQNYGGKEESAGQNYGGKEESGSIIICLQNVSMI